MSWSSVTEIVGFCLGVLYLYYEYKANARVWLVSLLMTLVSMQVYYSSGLYADFAMNIYYVVMAVYGYVAWTFHLRRHKKPELPIRRAGIRVLAWCAVACAVYRQQCPVFRCFHNGYEYNSHMDVGPEVCTAVVGMDGC